ncbi:sensor histidine kinase [Streptomyces iconiensis]|uniref:histidine kinase n=1 Tax=Streptomyces iconiensis TaxID=1384038 RepID=A0ABT6ZP15_9ACTN|nr:histidine kinase [Streptomyces iconiensis]MDJ1130802.1 histidine kinase [Streptomyces iconiensis]
MTSASMDAETRTAHPSRPRRVLRHPVVADCVAVGVAVWLSLVQDLKNPHLGPFPPWLNLTLGVVVALTLLARRRAPEVVLAVCLAAHVTQLSVMTLFLALYAEGAYRGPRHRRVAWGAALVSLLALSFQSTALLREPQHLLSPQALIFLLLTLVPFLLGMYVGERKAVLRAWVDRAERAEREQTLIADAAVAEERRRIAGEMHDVVSHQVSLMVVHANALHYVAGDETATKGASTTIATAGRQALDELREMIGVLRRPQGEQPPPDAAPPSATEEAATPHQDPGAAASGAGSKTGTETGTRTRTGTEDRTETDPDPEPGSGPVTNRPALTRLPTLIASSRSAGLPVVLRTTGEPRPLPESTERAAYRIVQEALTNVHKHASGAETEVTVAYQHDTVRVGVRNRAPSGERTGRGTAPDGTPLLPSGGHGLIGLRERVRLAGGTIDMGPHPDGGFQVTAQLPAPTRTKATAGTVTGTGASTGAGT